MEILIESILEQVLTVGTAIITAVVAAAGAAAIRYISARVKNDKLVSYAELLVFYAEKAVVSVAQTQAEILKEAAADGKLSEGEKSQLKRAAIETLRLIAPTAILAFATKAGSDIDALLDTLIEAEVHRNGLEEIE